MHVLLERCDYGGSGRTKVRDAGVHLLDVPWAGQLVTPPSGLAGLTLFPRLPRVVTAANGKCLLRGVIEESASNKTNMPGPELIYPHIGPWGELVPVAVTHSAVGVSRLATGPVIKHHTCVFMRSSNQQMVSMCVNHVSGRAGQGTSLARRLQTPSGLLRIIS